MRLRSYALCLGSWGPSRLSVPRTFTNTDLSLKRVLIDCQCDRKDPTSRISGSTLREGDFKVSRKKGNQQAIPLVDHLWRTILTA